MSVEELLELAAEYNWEVQYDVDGQLIFFTGVNDESKRVDPLVYDCLLYTSPSPRDRQKSRMPSSA